MRERTRTNRNRVGRLSARKPGLREGFVGLVRVRCLFTFLFLLDSFQLLNGFGAETNGRGTLASSHDSARTTMQEHKTKQKQSKAKPCLHDVEVVLKGHGVAALHARELVVEFEHEQRLGCVQTHHDAAHRRQPAKGHHTRLFFVIWICQFREREREANKHTRCFQHKCTLGVRLLRRGKRFRPFGASLNCVEQHVSRRVGRRGALTDLGIHFAFDLHEKEG